MKNQQIKMKYFTSVLFKYFVVRYESARDRKEKVAIYRFRVLKEKIFFQSICNDNLFKSMFILLFLNVEVSKV